MHRYVLTIIIITSISSACGSRHGEPGIRDIHTDIVLKRFEKELFSVDPVRIGQYIPEWRKAYGRFYDIYTNLVIRIGPAGDPDHEELLRLFVTDYMTFRIYERTEEVFSDMDWLKKDLEQTLGYYTYYFPGKPVPEIITFVGGFNQSMVSDSGMLGIGLDKYLGTGEEMYDELGVYSYLRMNMHRDKILSDCMRLWAATEFEFNDSVNNLVSHMIYEGRIMYLVDKLIPRQPDTLKWGFTNSWMEFCRINEKQMWTYLIENKLLFNSDRLTIDKYIREGPFTKDFGPDSPARAAVWIGYNLVKAYADQFPDLPVSELMLERDYQKILNLSGYNP